MDRYEKAIRAHWSDWSHLVAGQREPEPEDYELRAQIGITPAEVQLCRTTSEPRIRTWGERAAPLHEAIEGLKRHLREVQSANRQLRKERTGQ